jgi:transcriptional regulator of acetoin/glycerol metabolism
MNVVLKVAGIDENDLRDRLILALQQNQWQTSATAKQLGVSRRSLLRIIRRLNLRKKINEERIAAVGR